MRKKLYMRLYNLHETLYTRLCTRYLNAWYFSETLDMIHYTWDFIHGAILYTWDFIHGTLDMRLYTWDMGLDAWGCYTWGFIHETLYVTPYTWDFTHGTLNIRLYAWEFRHETLYVTFHIRLYAWDFIHETTRLSKENQKTWHRAQSICQSWDTRDIPKVFSKRLKS